MGVCYLNATSSRALVLVWCCHVHCSKVTNPRHQSQGKTRPASSGARQIKKWQNANMSAGQSFGSVIFAKASAVSSKQEADVPRHCCQHRICRNPSILDDGLQFPEGLGPGVLQTQLGYQPPIKVGMDGIWNANFQLRSTCFVTPHKCIETAPRRSRFQFNHH